MPNNYILAIDQSTSGTKAMLFDKSGNLIARNDIPHDQIISEKGYVEHNPVQIYENTINVVKEVIAKAAIDKNDIVGVGISNQRETAMIWDNSTGDPVYNAIVWQCARGVDICNKLLEDGYGDIIQNHTGLQLSPYFSAAKLSWLLENIDGLREKAEKKELYCGTMDSWLVYKLTGGTNFFTDYSNASRTQLFNIQTLQWDKELCDLFQIPIDMLPKVCFSDELYGETDFDGFLEQKIPIHGVLGDSHGALYGQGCLSEGLIKATYGTGSSIMMNIGKTPVFSKKGVVTSLAWGIDKEITYVLEGNINYAGAVIKWLLEDVKLIESPMETTELSRSANKEDSTYLVPAFTGLGAPYWDSKAKAAIIGMTRTTGKAEIVKASIESIAYQITDIIRVMSEDAGIPIKELRVDGGPTKNDYLMQFQSDILGLPVQVPNLEELSGIGVAYLTGIALGFYDKEKIFNQMKRNQYVPVMSEEDKERHFQGWKEAVNSVLTK